MKSYLAISLIFLSSPIEASELSWPMENAEVTSYYGVKRGARRHAGVDLAPPRGLRGEYVLVRAIAAGVVKAVHKGGACGHGVTVTHLALGLESTYCHLWRPPIVFSRQYLEESSTVIGFMGSTGNSTGPHLHLEIRDTKKNRTLDPLKLLRSQSHE